MDDARFLWDRFLAGDDSAFDEILNAYRVPLIRFLDGYLHNVDVAEDVAADCFAYLLAHPKKYDGRASLKTYLFTLGRSRALDLLRRRRKFPAVDPEDVKDVLPYDGPTPEEEVFRHETAEKVNAAVDALPEAERMAVRLVYFEGLSYKEAGRVLGKSAKQTDNLLVSAKKRLKKLLEAEGRELL